MEPWLNTCFLGPTRVHIPKRHLDQFSRFCTVHGWQSLDFTMGYPSPKIAPLHVRIWTPHLIHGSLGHPSTHPKQHLDQFSHSSTAHLTDRQTDHTTLSETVGRSYIRSTAMRPNYAILPNYIRMKQPGPLLYVSRNSQEQCSLENYIRK